MLNASFFYPLNLYKNHVIEKHNNLYLYIKKHNRTGNYNYVRIGFGNDYHKIFNIARRKREWV